jgi:preprotein translocase subunit YajC
MSGLILLPLLGAMVWLMIIPQRRQAKEQRALLAALEVGDAVMTSSGIYGIVTEIDADIMFLEVAEGIELKMSRASVIRRILDSDHDSAADDSTGAPAEGK